MDDEHNCKNKNTGDEIEYSLIDLKFIGFGNQYLSIFAIPLVLLYDYKKKKIIHWRICKKRKMNKFINFLVSFILYFFVLLFGFADIFIFFEIIDKYIKSIVKYIKENKDIIKELIKLLENINIF